MHPGACPARMGRDTQTCGTLEHPPPPPPIGSLGPWTLVLGPCLWGWCWSSVYGAMMPILVLFEQLVVDANLHRSCELCGPGDGGHRSPDLQQPVVQEGEVGHDVGCAIQHDLGPRTCGPRRTSGSEAPTICPPTWRCAESCTMPKQHHKADMRCTSSVLWCCLDLAKLSATSSLLVKLAGCFAL